MQKPLMNPQDCSTSTSTTLSSCGSSSSSCSYNFRSPQLNQFAHQNDVIYNPTGPFHLVSENTITLNCNPPNLSTWVDSFSSEEYCVSDPGRVMGSFGWVDNNNMVQEQQIMQQQQVGPLPLRAVHNTTMDHEESSIRLVHVLMTCADAVQRGDLSLAASLVKDLIGLLTRVNTERGIGKVAGYFIDALSRRLYKPQGLGWTGSVYENEILYHHFYEASPCLKFGHFMANQAILEAFDGYDCVHVIDFNIMQGLQWPALIQALALRPGGPPTLKLTGIGPPSNDGRDPLREVGMKLANLAQSVNVRFSFHGVLASRLDDIQPWMLKTGPKEEVVAVNSIMQLHKLLGQGTSHGHGSSINTVLGWIHGLNPNVVTIVEQEANHNQQEFLNRFTEALHYYSSMFDSLEGSLNEPEKSLAQVYIHREICNVVCCEGSSRIARHEPMNKWKARLSVAGFKQLKLGSNAFRQAKMLLTLYSAEGYCVEENDGCLTLGWHSRPLIGASAWQAVNTQCNT